MSLHRITVFVLGWQVSLHWQCRRLCLVEVSREMVMWFEAAAPPFCQLTAANGSLIARFMGPIWRPSGADRTQMDPMLAPWTLLSATVLTLVVYYLPIKERQFFICEIKDISELGFFYVIGGIKISNNELAEGDRFRLIMMTSIQMMTSWNGNDFCVTVSWITKFNAF